MRPHCFLVWCLTAVTTTALAAPVIDVEVHHAHLLVREEAEPERPENLTYVKYNKLKPLPETIPSGLQGELYKTFQPYFFSDGACIPYPAIGIDGQVR